MDQAGSARRRVADAFAHREGDRVPLWSIIENRGVYEHVLGPEGVGRAEEVGLDDKLRLHAEVYGALGIDMTRAQLWPPDPEQAGGPATHWRTREATADDVHAYRPQLPDADGRRERVEIGIRQIRANRPHTVFAPSLRGVFCPVFEAMGLEEFSYAAADSPAEIDRLMDAHAEHQRSLAELYAERDEVEYAAVCDDMAYKGGLLFGPAWMREHWRPRFARILEPLQRRGVRVVFHSDGNVEEMIPDLIELGVDGLNPLEPLAGMDVARLKSEYGNDLTLVGGLDCANLLPFGTPGEIRDEVRRLLEVAAGGGGFVIGESSQITPNTPLENVLAFYRAVQEA